VSPALIAGFADPASGLAGIGWRRGAESGGLLALAGRDPAPAAAAFEEDADRVVLRLEADGATAEAELAQDVTAPEDGRSEPAVRISRCAAAVRSAEGEPTECLGHATRWADDPLAGLGSLRHLAVPHGSALAIVIAGIGSALVVRHRVDHLDLVAVLKTRE